MRLPRTGASIAVAALLTLTVFAALAGSPPASAAAPSIAVPTPRAPAVSDPPGPAALATTPGPTLPPPALPPPRGSPSFPLAISIHPDASLFATILPNGTLSGLAAPIVQSGNLYTVTASFAGAILDERNGSTLDGAGFTITSSSTIGFGIGVNVSENVAVNGFTVAGAPDAVYVLDSTAVVVTDVAAPATTAEAFFAQDSTDVRFSHDQANSSEVGFAAIGSSGVDLLSGYANAALYGVLMEDDSDVEVNAVTSTGDTACGLDALSSASIEGATDNFSTPADAGVLLSSVTNASFVGVNGSDGGEYGGAVVGSSHTAFADSTFYDDVDAGLFATRSEEISLSSVAVGGGPSFGALYTYDTGLTVTGVSANDSGISGILLSNVSSASVAHSYALGDEWNGLSVGQSENVASRDDSFDSSSASGGNGTLVVGSVNVTLTGDTDRADPFGGVVVQYGEEVRVASTNVSNDGTYGVEFLGVSAAATANDRAFDDPVGFLYSSVTRFSAMNDIALDSQIGFGLLNTNAGTLVDSSASGCLDYGLLSEGDLGSAVVGDQFTACAVGAEVSDSAGTTLSGLNVSGSTTIGIDVYLSDEVTVVGSNVSGSGVGFAVLGDAQTTVEANSFYHNTDDFEISTTGAGGNRIFWNDFVDGSGWEFASGSASVDAVFDAGYPGGGNYWSNWTGPDTEHGPDQNLPGADGIVDVPFEISGSYVDPYPLTLPIALADLNLTFAETGLPGGATWGVTVGSELNGSSTGSTIVISTGAAAWATYAYSVSAPAGWTARPAAGSVTTDGAPQTVTIAFTEVTYAVSFVETGLATGTAWSVSVNGTSYSDTSTTITVALPNGSQEYSVSPVPGYLSDSAGGVVTVAANEPTVDIEFTAVDYAVTFTEVGLPSGTHWNVTLGDAAAHSSNSTIRFDVPNGTYPFSVMGVSGYSLVPSTGMQSVSGPGVSVTVAFTANPAGAPAGTALVWALVALVIVLAAILVVLLVTRPKRPAPPAPFVGATSAPAGVADTATPVEGGPPPGAISPSPPPWMES